MQKTPISPETRLLIASRILAGMQVPAYADSLSIRQSSTEMRDSALSQTDDLIEACDCYVGSGDPLADFFNNAKQTFLVPNGSTEGYKPVNYFPEEPVNDASGH